jgi:hypothetical protein
MSQLYAGGYDEDGIGQGHLLWPFGAKDSLTINSRLRVTAITEGFTDDKGMIVLVGTKDTGIYYRSNIMSMPIARYMESPNNETINDMITAPILSTMRSLLCIAVKSGVYASPLFDKKWSKIDSIKAEPLCLSGIAVNEEGKINCLYAGTTQGLFRFDSLGVAIVHNHDVPPTLTVTIQEKCPGLFLFLFQGQSSELVNIDIFNIAGKKNQRIFNGYLKSGRNEILWYKHTASTQKISPGIYILRISSGKNIVTTQLVDFYLF